MDPGWRQQEQRERERDVDQLSTKGQRKERSEPSLSLYNGAPSGRRMQENDGSMSGRKSRAHVPLCKNVEFLYVPPPPPASPPPLISADFDLNVLAEKNLDPPPPPPAGNAPATGGACVELCLRGGGGGRVACDIREGRDYGRRGGEREEAREVLGVEGEKVLRMEMLGWING
jgi:hypothetical protein